MKSETINRNSFKRILHLCFLFLGFILFTVDNLAAEDASVELDIQMRKNLEYERPPRLEEEDIREGRQFQFTTGLEIITDIEFVKVYLFDIEAGRTPFEDNNVKNGYVRVRLEKPGYRDYSFWVNVKNDFRTTVHLYFEERPESSLTTVSDNPVVYERESQPLYGSINPGDPAYYRQLYIMNSKDSQIHNLSLILDEDSQPVYSPLPLGSDPPLIFSWDGRNTLGEDQMDGLYTLQMTPGEVYDVRLDRTYSRRAGNYYSGTAGLLLVPSAQLLFPGGFQFGSNFTMEKSGDGDYSLPFSFFVRFSPVKRWEAAFESEVAFINESGEPSLRLNSSQKAFLYGNEFFMLSLGVRGSYKGAMNDLGQNVQNSIIRDPSGFSFFIPMQFEVSNWDFLISPEFLYSLNRLGTSDISSAYDMMAVVKWGVSYSNALFSAAFSSGLYLPSLQGNKTIMQAGVEGSFYVPDTPMYLNLSALDQRMKAGSHGYSLGINLGFLL